MQTYDIIAVLTPKSVKRYQVTTFWKSHLTIYIRRKRMLTQLQRNLEVISYAAPSPSGPALGYFCFLSIGLTHSNENADFRNRCLLLHALMLEDRTIMSYDVPVRHLHSWQKVSVVHSQQVDPSEPPNWEIGYSIPLKAADFCISRMYNISHLC